MYLGSLLASRYLVVKNYEFRKQSHGRKIHLVLSNTKILSQHLTWQLLEPEEMTREKVPALLPCHCLVLSSAFISGYRAGLIFSGLATSVTMYRIHSFMSVTYMAFKSSGLFILGRYLSWYLQYIFYYWCLWAQDKKVVHFLVFNLLAACRDLSKMADYICFHANLSYYNTTGRGCFLRPWCLCPVDVPYSLLLQSAKLLCKCVVLGM